jgi:2-polyprenyl-3-methyl-5-hydroxy-6-metoxy-1,4-benzoquinol methylase
MRKCRLCGSYKIIREVSSPSFEIFSCKKCTNAFTIPAPKPISYEKMDFHANAIKEEVNDQNKLLKDLPYEWRYSIERQVNILKKRVPKGGSILDIGCGEGILGGELIREGFQVSGIEPSLSASKRAIRRGIQVYTGYFPHPEVSEQYDAIVMSHVLEHIEDPVQTLRQLYATIRNKGYLLLIQTNYKGILPKKLKENWYAWVPEQHFWHFTPRGLTLLAKNYGFKLINNEYTSLVHGPNEFDMYTKYIPFLRDQFHLLLQKATV